MNFVDAAVALLREAHGPLHVEELCRLALERGLLDSPGASPLRSLKGRLTTELKRGPDSRVVRVEDDVWGLAHTARGEVDEDEPEAPVPEVDAAAEARGADERDRRERRDTLADHEEPTAADDEDGEDDEDDGAADAVGGEDAAADPFEDADEDEDEDEDDDDLAAEYAADEEGEDDDDADDEADDDEGDDDADDEADDAADTADADDEADDDEGDDEDDEYAADDDADADGEGDDDADDDDADDEADAAEPGAADDEAAFEDEPTHDIHDDLDEAVAEAAASEDEDADGGEDGEGDAGPPVEPVDPAALALERAGLSPEEADLVQAYGDDTGTAQLGALVEYRDHQTADEDRPMVPEILPERRGRGREDWKARRDRMREKRRERREERERNKAARDPSGGAAPVPAAAGAAAPAAAPAPAPAAKENGAAERAPAPAVAAAEPAPRAPVGEPDLARQACEVLASIKGGQPVPVRQLAQMMRKRRLVEIEPEALWRPLKAALLADHQKRTAAGLPPRVAYRGRDLFSYRPSANAELEAAETALESTAHRLRGATERALAARLVELALPVLEQVVQLYLVQTGWRDVEWIKRVDRSGYALAREPGEGGLVMVSARAGNQEVDRRGVGELRAGVAAKNLSRGFLLAPRELGTEARSELEREGKPVGALCGLRWASALVDAGIGVAQRTMPVSYLDLELFDRLSEG